ncbi:cryptochrome [Lophium mytilinum]|uniref:Cryptochrome DASH n=1 Tax=Lophium mytilinum TaxID=390894 RepID=A0A6A6R719_9PEZI|nr:cryptochrome [Lophium mytilinum]
MPPTPPPTPRILIYLLRHDLRLADNPIFHDLSRISRSSAYKTTASLDPPSPPICHSHSPPKSPTSARIQKTYEASGPALAEKLGVTHLLPMYVFPANQIEISGFLSEDGSGTSKSKSPYPEARSEVGGFWRTGPHRAKFIAESVWDLKGKLERLDCESSLVTRVGLMGDVVDNIVSWYSQQRQGEVTGKVVGIWMTGEEGTEEATEERDVRRVAEDEGIDFRIWKDEKYYVDDRDQPFTKISDLPNVYTTYRKPLEPLSSRPRPILPTPHRLPPLPDSLPPQQSPFSIPTTLATLKSALLAPLDADPTLGLPSPPQWAPKTTTAHPFLGGERAAHERLTHLASSGAMTAYKSTRNGMLGLDFSTKLSAYLAYGCLTARQVHWAMVDFEAGTGGDGVGVAGYGRGENEGTAAIRFELLWRDYMRLCARKFGASLFDIDGFRGAENTADDGEQPQPPKRWKYLDRSGGLGDDPAKTREALLRFLSGTTGIGLIDAAQRELFLTGYTSNRARQNVASFLASHLGIDWRVGAEWYESMLIDYDMANNWGNWQYVAGVGNDPRQGRVFNPVKQALDYDAQGEYVKAWVGELRDVDLGEDEKGHVQVEKLMGLFQAWRLDSVEKERLGLNGVESVEHPLIRIPFSVTKSRGSDGGNSRGRGRGGSYRGRGKGQGARRLGEMDKVARAGGAY